MAGVRYLDPSNETGLASDANDGLTAGTPWATFVYAATNAPDDSVCWVRGEQRPVVASTIGGKGQVLAEGIVRAAPVTFTQQPSASDWVMRGGTLTGGRENPLLLDCHNIHFDGMTLDGVMLRVDVRSGALWCTNIELRNLTGLGTVAGGAPGVYFNFSEDCLLEDWDFTRPNGDGTLNPRTFVVLNGAKRVTCRRGYHHDYVDADSFQISNPTDIVIDDFFYENTSETDPSFHMDGFQLFGTSGSNLTLRRIRNKNTIGSVIRSTDADFALTGFVMEQCVIRDTGSVNTVDLNLHPSAKFIANTIDGQLHFDTDWSGGAGPLFLGNIIDSLAFTGTPAYADFNAVRTQAGTAISGGSNLIGAPGDMTAGYVDRTNADLRPTASAPVVDAGAASGGGLTVPTTDYAGDARGAPPDIGAYEYQTGASTMTAFASDTFTDTSGTGITAHTADVGGPWVKHGSAGAAAASVISDAGRYRLGASSSLAFYYMSGLPDTAEYDVTADLVVVSDPAAHYMGVAGRINTAALTLYYALYNKGTARWELSKVVAGTATVLGFAAATLVASTTYALKLEIRDATKKLFVNGVELVSSSDNAITAAGRAGIYGGGSAGSNTTAYHLDNFAAGVTVAEEEPSGFPPSVGFHRGVRNPGLPTL